MSVRGRRSCRGPAGARACGSGSRCSGPGRAVRLVYFALVFPGEMRAGALLELRARLAKCEAVGWAKGLQGSQPIHLLGAGHLRAKGRASRCSTGCTTGSGGAFAACWSKARASHRALSPRWSSWFFHLHSPDSQTHRGFKHLQAAAGVVVMLISPIWFIKRAVVQIFQYYLTFPSSQDFVFELQCVQEVSDHLRHLMLGCSANYSDVANNM